MFEIIYTKIHPVRIVGHAKKEPVHSRQVKRVAKLGWSRSLCHLLNQFRGCLRRQNAPEFPESEAL